MAESRTRRFERVTDAPSVLEYPAIAGDFTELINIGIPVQPERFEVQAVPTETPIEKRKYFGFSSSR